MTFQGQRTVVVVDAGGRGAALVDKYAQSEHVHRLIAIPGNDLMGWNTDKPVRTYSRLKTTNVREIVELCDRERVALVDVAQDNAVAAGLVDALTEKGIPVVGPSRAAGQIEWDKAWAREFGERHDIPQPFFRSFLSPQDGIAFLRQATDRPWLVKAAFLAEGKGALAAHDNDEAIERIQQLAEFGTASQVFLLEEWLGGGDESAEEISVFAACDGAHYKIIGAARDHKRSHSGDVGENTGGMGANAPTAIFTPNVAAEVETEIFKPVLRGLRAEGRPYRGILYLGAMLVKANGTVHPRVVEFNARWGDPEAQVLVPGLHADLFELSMAMAQGQLENVPVGYDGRSRVVVSGASRGYPGDYSDVVGKRIFGLEEAAKVDGVTVYGAGVRIIDGKCYAAGGRLFHIVGGGATVIEARQKAYAAMARVSVDGNNLHLRTDIGWRDVERLYHSANRQ